MDERSTHASRSRPLRAADADRLGDEIAELSAHLDAATHRLLSLLRAFDEGVGWNAHGALSCAHWLCCRIGLELGAAREKVRVARALGALPRIDDALRRGQVSYSKVRALTRVATPENEATLLEMACSSTASQLERICRGYRRAVRGPLGVYPQDEADHRWVRERETESGMVRIEAQLTPEEAAVVRAALELAMRRVKAADVPAEISAEASSQEKPSEETSSLENLPAETPSGQKVSVDKHRRRESSDPRVPANLRRADALVAMAEGYLATTAQSSSAPPVEIVVHVEAEALRGQAVDACGTLDDGTPISPATTARLACDATLLRVVEDARGNPLAVARRSRVIPRTLRRALHLRDRGCRFPGCTNRRVDGHHVVPWSHGGATKLGNLLSLCRRHHRYVHEYGFRVESTGEAGVAFYRANGMALAVSPTPPPLLPDPVRSLRAEHDAAGLAIDASTSLPRWDGTRSDYGYISEVLVASRDRRGGSVSSP